MSKKKTATSANNQVSSTAPTDPAVSNAYSGLLTRAQGVAGQPLQLYNAPLVAGLTPDQQSAISQIGQSTSLAAPYLTSAAGYAQQGATPISATPYSAANVNQYYSPFQNDVVNATQAQFDLGNKEQQTSLAGNTAAAGAYGGDRMAVLQAELAKQQNASQAPVIAGLENQGFQTAQGEFNTQQGVGLQTAQANNQNAANAAYSLGSLGSALQNSSLSGAGALLNAGGLEQQVNQENLNVPYEQYLQTQAYPYQNLNFLASLYPSIAQGTGITSSQNSNGTSSSTSPFNPLSMIGLGQPYMKAGGRVRRGLADGGNSIYALSGPDNGPNIQDILESNMMARDAGGYPGSSASSGVPDVGQSYVPSATAPATSLGSSPLTPMSSPNLPSSGGSGAGGGGSNGFNFGSSPIGQAWNALSAPTSVAGDAGMEGVADMGAGIGGDVAGASLGSSLMSSLGLAGLFHKGGRTRLQDGGEGGDTPDDTISRSDEWLPGWGLTKAAFTPGYGGSEGVGAMDRSPPPRPAPPAPSLATPAAPTAQAPQVTIAPPQRAPVPQPTSLAAADPDAPTGVPGSFTPDMAYPAGASLADADDIPPEWRSYRQGVPGAMSLADASPESLAAHQTTWDDGTPVNQPADDPALGQSHTPHTAWEAPEQKADWGHVALSGLAGFLSHGTIGAGLKAGMDEYDAEKDPHPAIDHSGSTMMISYGGKGQQKQLFDLGIPTEASLSAKAMNDYRMSNEDMNERTREDRTDAAREAAAERAHASEDSIAERAQAAKEAAADRAERIRIAEMNADAGRWTYAGTDTKTGRPIMLNSKDGTTRLGDTEIGAKPLAARQPTPMAQSTALQNAQRDYDRFFPAPKPNPLDPTKDILGNPMGPRPVPPEGMQAWLKNRAQGYMSGGAGQQAPQGGNGPAVPPRPTTVPSGAQYSPSRHQWRDSQGTLYNEAGQRQ